METVVECKKSKEWTNPKNQQKVPIYAIGLSDGRGGESFGKEIPVGTPVSDLSIEEGQYGLKIKLKGQQGGGWSGGGRRSGNESFALSYAKDLVVGGKVDMKQILPVADKLYDWLESKKPAPVVLASQLRAKVSATAQNTTDDLPF